MITLIAILLAFVLPRAQACGDAYKMHGNIDPLVERYDKMLGELAEAPDPVAALDAFLKKDGLPISFAAKDDKKVKGDYIEAVGTEGSAIFFVQKLRPPQKSLALEKIFEIANKDSKKALRTWQVPADESDLAGLQGNELLMMITLKPFCGTTGNHLTGLAIKPDGAFRILTVKPNAGVEIENCPAAKAL
jgi:hypothetical protein